MMQFKAAFLNEIDKTYKKKKVLFIGLLSVFLILLGQGALLIVNNKLGIRGAGSGEFPKVVLSFFSITILPLFTALISIDIFSGEKSNGTLKILLTRPVSRFKILLAKVAAIMSFLVGILVLVLIFSSIIGVVFNSSDFTMVDVYSNMLAYFVTIIPVSTLALLIVFLGNIFKSGVSTFFVSSLVCLILLVCSLLFSQYSRMLLISNLNWYNLWLMDTVGTLNILRIFLISTGANIMLFTGSYYLFEKRSV